MPAVPAKRHVVVALALLVAFTLTLLPGSACADRPAPLSAQTLKAPSGPTSLKGLGESFSANASTGTGSYSIPIQLPAGFVAPNVKLVYTGGTGRGEVGMGFSLPFLQIYRQTDKGAPKFTESDRFAVSGPDYNDELVAIDVSRKRYRLKNEGAFLMFERDAANDRWIVRQPDGKRTTLGQTLASRGKSLGRTTRWYAEETEDVYGHLVSYRYQRHGNRVYLLGIDYQQEAAEGYRNRVEFVYEARPDIARDFSLGEDVTLAQRLHSIEVWQGRRLLRRYTLTYEESALWSLLTRVAMEGEGGLSLPTLTLGYLKQSSRSGNFVRVEGYRSLTGLDTGRMTLEDVNGDGLPDLLEGTAVNYAYYENLDGVRFSSNPVQFDALTSPDRNLESTGVVLADVDGDGYRDVLHPIEGKFRYYPGGAIKDGKFLGFGAAKPLSSSNVVSDVTTSDIRLTDLNGDGRTDFLRQREGTSDVWVENSAADGLVQHTIPELPAGVALDNPQIELSDFNGDGVLDLIAKEFANENHFLRIWYGLGSGKYKAEAAMWASPEAFEKEVHLLDVNRDGQLDFVRVSGSWVGYWLNDGRGSFAVQHGDFRGMPSMSRTKKLLFADMNGNGTTDIVWVLADGGMSYLDLMEEPNVGLLSRVDNGMGMITEISYRSSMDYMVDAKLRGEPWKTPMPHPVAVISEVLVSDSLDRVGVSRWQSRRSYDYRDGYYDAIEREFRGFARVVTTEHGDEFQSSQISELHVHVGRNLETGADEEGLKGRPWMQLIRDGNGQLIKSIETHLEQRYLCQEDLDSGIPPILPSCIGVANRQEHKDELVCLAIMTGELVGYWEGTTTPRYTAEERNYDSWGNVTRHAKYGEVAVAGGRQPGDVWGIDQSIVALGNDEVIEETALLYDVSQWLLGVPYQIQTKDYSGSLLAVQRTYYDGQDFVGLPLGQAKIGRATRIERWLAQTQRWVASERNAYNADGLVTGRLDAAGNLRETGYDPFSHLLPSEERVVVEDGGKLTFSAGYDPATSAITAFTEPNGNTTSYRYDGLGRLTAVIEPRASEQEPSRLYAYTYGDTSYPVSTVTTRQLVNHGQGNYRQSVEYFDGLGRKRLTKRDADDGQGVVASEWQILGSRGQPGRVSEPFSAAGWDFQAAPTAVPALTTLRDAVGRVVREYQPATAELGTAFRETRYLPLETRSYDERDSTSGAYQFPTISRLDGLERVRLIERLNLSNGLGAISTWQMNYDGLGQLRSIEDGQGHKRIYDHDSLGRLTAVNDPNMGPVHYTYDDDGRLLTRRDVLSQETRNTYGAAGRLTKQAYFKQRVTGEESPDYEYSFHYDRVQSSGPHPAARNLLGRMSWAEYPVGSEHFSYDENGRVESETRLLWDGHSPFGAQVRTQHVRTVNMNAAGEEDWRELSGGLRIETQRTRRGLVDRMTVHWAAESQQVLQGVSYNTKGLVLESRTGNGLKTCQRFDARGQITGVLVRGAENTSCDAASMDQDGFGLYHLQYQWGYDGLLGAVKDLSVDRRSDGVSRLSARYGYDPLHQLTTATLARWGAAVDEAYGFEYDSIQNLTKRTLSRHVSADGSETNEIQNFGYGLNAGPNAVTSVTKAGAQALLEYDAIGQLTSLHGYTLKFDPGGNLASAQKGQKTIEYHYDAWGERKLLITREGGATTHVYRYPFEDDWERDGVRTLRFDTGVAEAEVALGEGLRIDAILLGELEDYVNAPENAAKPLPEEYLDLDGDGDGFDLDDLAEARSAFWSNRAAGPPRTSWRYVHRDHLGGASVITDARGDSVSTRQYDPYGGVLQRRGLQPATGFAGGETEPDEELGLVRMGARYYAASLGRWISPDRFVGESPSRMLRNPLESNLFSYARNSVTNRKDPTGNQSTPATGSDSPSSPAVSDASAPDEESSSRPNQSVQPSEPKQNTSMSPECEDLLKKIVDRVNELKKRYQDLIEDKMGLPPTGRMSIEGHRQQFENKQDSLLKLLNQWDTNTCGGGKPVDAWKWATRPAPKPAPKTNSTPMQSTPETKVPDGVVEGVIVGGAALGTGYLVYRTIRMIPSLFFPPSIPVNLAVP